MHTEASISLNLTDLLHLQFAQVRRSPDLAIFVSMTVTTEPISYFTHCACTQGKNSETQSSYYNMGIATLQKLDMSFLVAHTLLSLLSVS